MLDLRPICEHCATGLPPDSAEAMICSYECTFCASCVDGVLDGVCPNCGGGFMPRPIRPATTWIDGAGLEHDPATTQRKHRPVDPERHRALLDRVGGRPPGER